MKRQSGFTLIELIIVIVILGILAVVAAPQFFNFGSDARASTVRGLEGSIKAASELVHARAQINLRTDDQAEKPFQYVEVREGGGQVTVEGLYAVASKDGIVRALNLDDNDWGYHTVRAGVAGTAPVGAFLIFPTSKQPSDHNSDDTACYAYYHYPNTGEAPEIGSFTKGC